MSVCAELIAIGLAGLAGRDERTYYATKKGRCWIAESEGGGSKYTEYGL